MNRGHGDERPERAMSTGEERADRADDAAESSADANRNDGAPSKWDPDRTGPSRDGGPVDIGRSEPWTGAEEGAQGGFRSEGKPQSGEARHPDE